MDVIGIDFSSKAIDIVTIRFDADEPRWTHIPITGSFDGSRAMRDILPPASWWENTLLVAVEKPMSQQRNSISALMRLQGAIVASVPRDIRTWELPPWEWKKEIGLAGNAKKVDVAVWALDHGADLEWSQDACDALGLATAALNVNARALEEAA